MAADRTPVWAPSSAPLTELSGTRATLDNATLAPAPCNVEPLLRPGALATPARTRRGAEFRASSARIAAAATAAALAVAAVFVCSCDVPPLLADTPVPALAEASAMAALVVAGVSDIIFTKRFARSLAARAASALATPASTRAW
eukprot:scaffold262947_cov24-Tisochrysis_lutea.AAC.3